MQQATLDLDTLPTHHADRVGFDLGWDHAHHGLVPPVELMLDGTPLRQGWAAARAVFGQRTLAHPRTVRQWLQLRTAAWREGVAFEGQQLTPNYLAQLEAVVCPVTRQRLGGMAAEAAVLQRLVPRSGFAAGHLATLSQAAALAVQGLAAGHEVADAWACAKRAAAGSSSPALADAAVWQRLAVLLSFVTPLPHAQAARLPLHVLPPNRLRVLNAIQGLQVVLTWQLASHGWSGRLRDVAAMIEVGATRHEFLLFVGALAPRVMALPDDSDRIAQRQALEDLWSDERVQRRWTQFALLLDEGAAEALATRAAAVGLRGRRVMVHGTRGATEGWAGARLSGASWAAKANGPAHGTGLGAASKASA